VCGQVVVGVNQDDDWLRKSDTTHVLTQDMNADLTAEILDPCYRHILVSSVHYMSRANY
jgi:hypothetical protein